MTELGATKPGGTGPIRIDFAVPRGALNPAGKPEWFALVDRNGVRHECVAEAFTNTYQVFVLIHVQSAMTSTRIIMPAAKR